MTVKDYNIDIDLLSDIEELPDEYCYVIIGDYVMEFENGVLMNSHEVQGCGMFEKAESFISYCIKNDYDEIPEYFIYDDTGMYSAMVIEDMGYFTDDPLDGADEEDINDWESLSEYFSEH